MKQLVHRTVSATNAVALPAAEAYSRLPLTLKSRAIRGRMKEQRQQSVFDSASQAERNGLHGRLLNIDSLVLFTGLY
jgi:hypothetical protein